MFLACDDELNIEPNEEIPSNPIDTTEMQMGMDSLACMLALNVHLCSSVDCPDPEQVSAAQVTIHADFDSAIEGIEPLAIKLTNEEGQISFDSLDCNISYYISLVDTTYGHYIGSFSFTDTLSINQEIRLVEGYSYREDSVLIENQKHISLTAPAVGQTSKYLTYEFANLLFDVPEYLEDSLEVCITDQLSSTRFIVEERLSEGSVFTSRIGFPDNNILKNIWRFENDSLYIEPYEGDFEGSWIWNLTVDFGDADEDGFAFPLIRPQVNPFDMSTEEFHDIDFWEGGYVEDYELLGAHYSELISYVTDQQGVDGPLRFRCYNNADGVIRSIDFNRGGSLWTLGFDLLNQ